MPTRFNAPAFSVLLRTCGTDEPPARLCRAGHQAMAAWRRDLAIRAAAGGRCTGHVYAFTGNGWTHGCSGQTQWYAHACEIGQPKPAGYYGESLVRLDPRNGLALVGSWTPRNWCEMELGDATWAAPGQRSSLLVAPAGSPTRTFAVGGGKEGRLYAIDTSAVAQPDEVEGLSRASPTR